LDLQFFAERPTQRHPQDRLASYGPILCCRH